MPTVSTSRRSSRSSAGARGALLLALTLCGPAHAERWALLIGIDDYVAERDLSGCKNDIRMVQDVLTRDFVFPSGHIETLLDGEATQDGILATFQSHLIDNSAIGSDDVVLVWYSGHGSRVPDSAPADENDGFDETLVPQDSRTPGVFDITDDQVNGLMEAVAKKAGQVVFVLDSCHSGTATRGGATEREVAPDTRPQPASRPFATTTRAAGGDSDLGFQASNWLLISACLATEKANETSFPGGAHHGALTWFLRGALAEAKDGATYRSVFDQANRGVTGRFLTQHPQIEGPGQDVALFGLSRIPKLPYVLVEAVEDGRIRLDAGEIRLVGVGSILHVYPPGTTGIDESQALAKIEITASDAFDSWARVVSGGPVVVGARAALSSVVYASEPIPLHVAPGLLDLIPDLAMNLETKLAVRVVDWPRQARLILDLRDGMVVLRGEDLAPLKPALNSSAADLKERIAGQVRATVRWMALRDLKNPGADLRLRFDLRPKGTAAGTPLPDPITDGAALTLRVRNDDTESGFFLYVIDISTDGRVYLALPDEGDQIEIGPGEEADMRPDIRVFLPPGVDGVTDTFKLIATTQRIDDPSVFVIDEVAEAATREVPKPTGNPLVDFLVGSAMGIRAAAPLPPKAWGTVERTVRVAR